MEVKNPLNRVFKQFQHAHRRHVSFERIQCPLITFVGLVARDLGAWINVGVRPVVARHGVA